jgi:hypothetical protein
VQNLFSHKNTIYYWHEFTPRVDEPEEWFVERRLTHVHIKFQKEKEDFLIIFLSNREAADYYWLPGLKYTNISNNSNDLPAWINHFWNDSVAAVRYPSAFTHV